MQQISRKVKGPVIAALARAVKRILIVLGIQ